ncbi:MAG: Beta-lactamase related protein [uncultured Friedmanniella sp.]|uniref:Beta-lactamase related protein n=1 Tax=uncultured Friedmanniella sp. TaxID=335381 RepID=A0A6J4JY47_9ACTN|nr:MAG: Beta-lactamase related protein [uncultured Friedmanniella sp.]
MPVPTLWMLPDLPAFARWSVAVRDAGSGAVLAADHPDQLQLTASIGKLFLLVEVAARLAEGALDPEEPLTWTAEEHVADSAVWYWMDRRALGVRDLCVLVGAFSDNLATNVLLRRVGLAAVQARAAALGCTRSTLLDRTRLRRTPADPPTLSVGTAAELSAVLADLHRGAVVSAAVSAQVLAWLAANADLSMVAAAFDLDPLAHAEPDRGVTLVNKTGTIATARGEILALLLRLKRDLGLGALVITHDLGLAWNIADRVLVMHRGRVVESGRVEQVLLDPQHDYTRSLLAVVPSELGRR